MHSAETPEDGLTESSPSRPASPDGLPHTRVLALGPRSDLRVRKETLGSWEEILFWTTVWCETTLMSGTKVPVNLWSQMNPSFGASEGFSKCSDLFLGFSALVACIPRPFHPDVFFSFLPKLDKEESWPSSTPSGANEPPYATLTWERFGETSSCSSSSKNSGLTGERQAALQCWFVDKTNNTSIAPAQIWRAPHKHTPSSTCK